MWIEGVAMVGSEADIIEAFVRHNLQFLNHLTVLCHQPTDDTAAILAALVQEGLPLQVLEPAFAGFQQGAELTRVAKAVFAAGCDFVVPLDADEFIKLPRPDYLRAALPAIPGDRFGCVRWQNYAPLDPADCQQSNPLLGLVHRRVDEPTPIFKVILTRRFADPQFHLIEGSHCVMGSAAGGVAAAPQPMVELKAIRLAHFPLRSMAQAASKVRQAMRAKAGDAMRTATAAHWWRLADRLQGAHSDFQLLAALALDYPELAAERPAASVRDPLPVAFELRYSNAAR